MAHMSHSLSEEETGHYSFSWPTESRLRLQGILHSIDEGQQHTQSTQYIQATQNEPDQTLSAQPLDADSRNDSPEAKDEAIQCAIAIRISALCNEEFRFQAWYQHNLLSTMAIMIGIAAILLPLSSINDYMVDRDLINLMCFLAGVIPFILMTPIIIPLHGMQSMIDTYRLTRRHPMSPVRFAIDPGRRYCVLRCVFFLSYIVFAALFSVEWIKPSSVFNRYGSTQSFLLVPPGVLCLLAFCTAFVMSAVSIYRQLFPRRTVEEIDF